MKPIRELVPHQGAMCLLAEVLEWNQDSIACRASSHRDPANPLCSDGGLSAIVGVEYAAQAVAAHASLAQETPVGAGYLAALRDVTCTVERLDTEAADLVVRAQRLAAESGRLLYDFRIEAGGRELLRGRLSIAAK